MELISNRSSKSVVQWPAPDAVNQLLWASALHDYTSTTGAPFAAVSIPCPLFRQLRILFVDDLLWLDGHVHHVWSVVLEFGIYLCYTHRQLLHNRENP